MMLPSCSLDGKRILIDAHSKQAWTMKSVLLFLRFPCAQSRLGVAVRLCDTITDSEEDYDIK